MSNKLLDTLQKIEDERQTQIYTARKMGYNVASDASFSTLATCMNQNAIDYDDEPEDWVRPSDWPDGEAMLNEMADRGNLKPGIFFLLDAAYSDDIFLPQKYVVDTATAQSMNKNEYDNGSGYMNTVTFCNTNADAYLLSDGTYIDDVSTSITHTWDKSKDIECEDATYRWIILFFDNDTINYGQVSVQTWPVTEAVFKFWGKIETSYQYNYYLPSYLSTSTSASNYASQLHLVNIITMDYLATSSLSNTQSNPIIFGSSAYFNNSWRHRYMYSYYKIRNIEFGKLGTSYINQNTGCIIGNSSLLTRIKIDNCTNLSYFDFAYMPNLKEIYITGSYSGSLNFSDNSKALPLYLKKIYAPSLTIGFGGTQSYIDLYIRGDLEITASKVYYINIPTNAVNCSYSPSSGGIIGSNSGDYVMNRVYPYLEYLDLTNASPTSNILVSSNNTTNFRFNIVAPRLKWVEFHTVISYRTKIITSLSIENLRDIINKLQDLTGSSVYNPYIYLSIINYNKLNANDKKAIADKGWELILC